MFLATKYRVEFIYLISLHSYFFMNGRCEFQAAVFITPGYTEDGFMKESDDSTRQGFSEIGGILVRDAEIITGKWVEKERSVVSNSRAAHRDGLKNYIPGYLRTLGSDLTKTGMKNSNSQRLARDLGAQRRPPDLKLSDVIADYQHLQVTLLEHLSEILRRSLTVDEMKAIGSDIDAAVMVAVEEFVNHSQAELQAVKRKYEKQIEENTRFADARISGLTNTTVDLVKSKDSERKRVAGILRDDLLQLMSVCRLRTEALLANIDEDAWVGELETIIHILRKALSVAKKLTRELNASSDTRHTVKINDQPHCVNSCDGGN